VHPVHLLLASASYSCVQSRAVVKGLGLPTGWAGLGWVGLEWVENFFTGLGWVMGLKWHVCGNRCRLHRLYIIEM